MCDMQLGFVIAMVTGIHFVEAYLLNPAIYSAHLKLHPLLVISTLVVAEHSLGVWGLLLAGEQALHAGFQFSHHNIASLHQNINLELPFSSCYMQSIASVGCSVIPD